MRIRFLSLLLALLMLLGTVTLLSACKEDDAPPADDGGETPPSGDEDEGEGEGDDEDDGPEETVRQTVYLPSPYINIDFANGQMTDACGNVDCVLEDEEKGYVITENVKIGATDYNLPHLYVETAGGVGRLTYNKLETSADLLALLRDGFTMEAFAVNHNSFEESSPEQCLISSTQSGGYNFTVHQGRYTFSSHTGGAYNSLHASAPNETVSLTHFLGVYDPNLKKATFYINGKKTAESDAPGTLKVADGDAWTTIFLGSDTNPSCMPELSAFNVRIADFKFYPDSMTEEQAGKAYQVALSALTGGTLDFDLKYYGKGEAYAGERLFASYNESYAKVYEPLTGIVNSPTVMTYADTLQIPTDGMRPATFIFEVRAENGQLLAYSKSGTKLGTLHEAVAALQKKSIPAFSVNDAATAGVLADFITYHRIGDCFVISQSKDILLALRNSTRSARPVLDMTGNGTATVAQICRAVSQAQAKSVILPSSAMTAEKVTELRAYALSVFLVPDRGGKTDIRNAIFKGAMGLVTSEAATAIAYMESITEPTLCFPTMIVAHRGDMQNYPENVMRSFISAAQSGADVIELDTYLTKDGHVAINHDSVATHWSQKLNITQSTKAQLKALTNIESDAIATDEFPFLDEVFDYFSQNHTDVYFTVEIKDYRNALIDKIVALADEYGMRDRIIIICMNAKIVSYAFRTYGVAVQKNISTLYSKTDLDHSLAMACDEATALNSSFFTQWGDCVYDLNKMLRHRGIKYSPWTTQNVGATDEDFAKGYPEFTTNTPHRIDDYARYLTVSVSGNGTVTVTRHNYDGNTATVTTSSNLEFVCLSGNVTYNASTKKVSGTGTFAFVYAHTNLGHYTYHIYSQACEI